MSWYVIFSIIFYSYFLLFCNQVIQVVLFSGGSKTVGNKLVLYRMAKMVVQRRVIQLFSPEYHIFTIGLNHTFIITIKRLHLITKQSILGSFIDVINLHLDAVVAVEMWYFLHPQSG
jgi:hypothetical protein